MKNKHLSEDIFITLLPNNASLNSRGHMEDLLIENTASEEGEFVAQTKATNISHFGR